MVVKASFFGGQGRDCRLSVVVLLVEDFYVALVHLVHVGIIPAPDHLAILIVIVVDVLVALEQQSSDLLVPLRHLEAAVSGAQNPLRDHILGHGFHVVSLPQLGEEVDECGGEVGAVSGELGGFVVPGKDVMVVMPALAHGKNCNHEIVRWLDGS